LDRKGEPSKKRSELEILYKTIYIPTMWYTMQFTGAKKEYIHKIASKSIALFLKKFDYTSTASQDIVYGPAKLGGLRCHNLDLETGINQLEQLVHALNDKNQLGLLILATMKNWF
jgi:hypothetical protein